SATALRLASRAGARRTRGRSVRGPGRPVLVRHRFGGGEQLSTDPLGAAVREDRAVELVRLMLQAARQHAGALDLDRLAVEVEPPDASDVRTGAGGVGAGQ